MVGCIARAQQFRNIAFAPIPDPFWRDVRDIADLLRVGAAGEAQFRLDGSEAVSGGMTLRAMPNCLHQVLPAVPGISTGRVRNDRLAIKKQQLPKSEQSSYAKRQRQIMRRWLARNGRQRPQISDEIADVANLHLGEIGIGKHRVIVSACRRDPAQYGVGQVYRPPRTYAVNRVGGYVGYAESAVGRGQCQSAAETQPVGLTRGSVTGAAIAERKYQLPFCRITIFP